MHGGSEENVTKLGLLVSGLRFQPDVSKLLTGVITTQCTFLLLYQDFKSFSVFLFYVLCLWVHFVLQFVMCS